MMSRTKKICILCEGYEEYDYINRLSELKVWNGAYEITAKNAKGLDNIAPIYQNEFHSDNFDLIVIFCDTELPPYAQFKNLQRKINLFHDKNIAKYIIFFANPCSMQIILSHFDSVELHTNSKLLNTPLIVKLAGLRSYNAKASQRAQLMRRIDRENYYQMRANVSTLDTDFKVNPSTNFLGLILNLESPNTAWVDRLARKAER